jgi:hypothetical protein
MDALVCWLGPLGTFGAELVAASLVLFGLLIRVRARRRHDLVSLALAGQRKLACLQPGPVALTGTWRNLDGRRGVLEDPEGAAVLVEHALGPAPLADGASVLAVGVAMREVDDPRPVAYRAHPRLWLVALAGPGQRLTREVDALGREQRRARRRSALGGALFALGLLLELAGLLAVNRYW